MQENKSCCFFVHNVQLTEYCSSYVNHPRSDSLERSVFQKCRFVFVCLSSDNSWTIWDIIIKFYGSKIWTKARTNSKMTALWRTAGHGCWFNVSIWRSWWIRHSENRWTDFDADLHKWSIKWSTVGVRRSTDKIRRGRRMSQKSHLARGLKNYPTNLTKPL